MEYFVAVYTLTATGQPDELVLCAELKGKKAKKGKKRGDDKGGKGRSENRGHDKSGKREAASRGQEETKPGKRKGKGALRSRRA